jgi:hypothetical protein
MLYVVQSIDDGTWTLHRENGDRIGGVTWDDRPTTMDLVDALADEHNAVSILGDPDVRREHAEVVTGELEWARDDTALPWE